MDVFLIAARLIVDSGKEEGSVVYAVRSEDETTAIAAVKAVIPEGFDAPIAIGLAPSCIELTHYLVQDRPITISSIE